MAFVVSEFGEIHCAIARSSLLGRNDTPPCCCKPSVIRRHGWINPFQFRVHITRLQGTEALKLKATVPSCLLICRKLCGQIGWSFLSFFAPFSWEDYDICSDADQKMSWNNVSEKKKPRLWSCTTCWVSFSKWKVGQCTSKSSLFWARFWARSSKHGPYYLYMNDETDFFSPLLFCLGSLNMSFSVPVNQ